MKKQLLYVLTLIFSIGVLSSCEDDDEVVSINPTVAFDTGDPVLSIEEGSDEVQELTVKRTGAYTQSLEVYFTMTGDDIIEVINEDNFIHIPAGERTGKLLFTVIDNDVFDGPDGLSLDITLVGSNGEVVISDNEFTGFHQKTIALIDDEEFCEPADQEWNIFVTTLEFEDVGFATGLPATGTFTENNCDLIVTGDLPNAGVAAPPFILTMEPSGNNDGLGTVVVSPQIYCTNCSAGLNALYSGSGIYDVNTQRIEINYSLDRTDGANFFTGTTLITLP